MNRRTIKFRVWDNKYKCWIGKSSHDWVGSGIGNLGLYDKQPWTCMSFEGQFMSNDNMGGFVDDDQSIYVIQQYTGLKDKEGREIYEGDIVSWSENQGWEDGRTFTGFYEVKWNENTLRFDFYEIHGNVWWELADTQFDCVVGNIFENPELLK